MRFSDADKSLFVLGEGHVRVRVVWKNIKKEDLLKYIDCREEIGKKEIFTSIHSTFNLNADILLNFLC